MSIMNIGYIFHLIYIPDDRTKNAYGFNRALLFKVCDKNRSDHNISTKNKTPVRTATFKVHVETLVRITIPQS